MANPEDRDPVGKVPTSTSPGPQGAGPQGGNISFRCSDVHPQCNWEARGSSESDLRSQIEQHARERHDLRNLEDETWNRVRGYIRRAA